MRNRGRAGRASALQILTLAPFLAIAAALVSGCGRGPAPSTADAIGKRHGWNIFLAEPCADTLAAAPDDVMPAVERTFEADHWRIERKDSRNGVVVTAWKPIQHALVRVFAGKIEARCAVTVRPLKPDRSVVTFQAGISSRKNISHNPALGLAKNAYEKASRNWQKKLRADLVRHHVLEEPTTAAP